MRLHRTRVLGPLLLIALAASGCGSAHGPDALHGHLRPFISGRVRALRITSSRASRLLGTPPPVHGWLLINLAMATAQLGWAAGSAPFGPVGPEGNYALETTDGGRQFRQVFAPPERIVGVAAPDARHAYFLESDCITSHGCESYLQLLAGGSSTPVTLWHRVGIAASAVSFPAALDGFIATVASVNGSPGKSGLYTTTDGGQSFTQAPLPCPGWAYAAALDFTDAQQGWLLCGGEQIGNGQAKSLFRTLDGGRRWSRVAVSAVGARQGALPAQGEVGGISFASPQTGYITLDGLGVFRTTDAGSTWTKAFSREVPSGLEPYVSAGFLPGGFSWLLPAYGYPLLVSRSGGQSWQPEYTPPPSWVRSPISAAGRRSLSQTRPIRRRRSL